MPRLPNCHRASNDEQVPNTQKGVGMKYFATLLILFFMTALASAQLVKEDFDFPDGEAIDTLGWDAHSGSGPAMISDSVLTYSGYAGSGVGNALDVFGTGEDVNKTFPVQSRDGETIYLSALIKVTESGNDLSGSYFLHLGNKFGTSFYFCARVFLKVDASDNVVFGLSNSSTPDWGTTNFAKNTTYLLILKYKISKAGNDTTDLWVLPSGVPGSEAAAGAPEVSVDDQTGENYINAVAIRQASGIPDYVLDGIRVASTWENSVGGVDAPVIALSPGSIDFGKVLVGKSAAENITVKNAGYASLDIASVTPSASVYTVTPGSASIPPQDSINFAVRYTPTAVQLDSESVAFVSNAASSPDTVGVRGKGSGAEPGFSVSSGALDFHNVLVGKSKIITLTVTNDGFDSLYISSVTSTNAAFSVSPASARMDSMASQKFAVTFTPVDTGSESGFIVFANNSASGHDTVAVIGSGSKVISIADARKDADGDLVPDHLAIGDTLFVAGVVIAPNVQTPPQSGYFIQDETAGIEVFSYDSAIVPIEVGDSVFVVGTIDQYHGLTEFVPLEMDTLNLKILKRASALPKPKILTPSQFLAHAEQYEGSLVKVDSLYYVSGTWPAEGANGSVYYTTKAGGDTIQIFIDKDTEVDGSTQPKDPVNVTGVLSQYSSGSSNDNGYELIPRDTSDIRHSTLDAISERMDGIPREFYLRQNYPNPFNPSTVIEFGLPKESQVEITVFNVLGQRVAVLADGVMKAGNHKLVFNGSRLASGVYFYLMRTGERILKQKMLLMK